ncbi:MAG: hypothetical protein K6E86_07615 [Bacteroidales bacterium]|nr:hypothetical protein [Bacteroidales bacterium]
MTKTENRLIPLLLTATVNPRGMQGANFTNEQRTAMYVEALRFYVERVSLIWSGVKDKGPMVVFAENSGSISVVRQNVDSPYIEWVDVSGPEYDQSRGKGYNETILIRKAIMQSAVIREAGWFFKVTGRLRVLNVESLINEVLQAGPDVQFRADCKDHSVYEWLHLPINGHVGECRYWFATVDFFNQVMCKYQDRMCDYPAEGIDGKTVSPYLAEDAMLAVCRETRGMDGCRDRFRCQARISGRGGHDLGRGMSFFYSTDNDSVALRFKCALRQCLRWIMPFWRC